MNAPLNRDMPADRAGLRRPMMWLLAVGPGLLVAMFAIRSVRPVVDPTLVSIWVVLLAATVGTILANRIAAGALALLAVAMFQPMVARDLSFSLSGIDSGLWTTWAVVTIIATGWTLVTALVVLAGRPVTMKAGTVAAVVGVSIGVMLLGVFPVLSPQPAYGSDLSADQISELPVIAMVNYAYGLPSTDIASMEPYLAKLVNPSDLPHTFTIESLDLEVYVPAERWAVVEIDPAQLANDTLTIICTIGDHLDQGMTARVDVDP